MRIKSKLISVVVVFVLVLSVMTIMHLLDKTQEPKGSQISKEDEFDDVLDEVELATYLFTTDYLNLRVGPGTNFEKIRTLPVGVKVEIMEYENGWYKVLYNGEEGYCIEDYLSDRLEEEETDEQSIPEEDFEEGNTGEVMKIINGILLVNKEYGLPADYFPGENEEALLNLNEMIRSAKAEINKEIISFSGFRSFNYQKKLYQSSIELEGSQHAEIYSAKPGHSEHQTGLAFDLGGEMEYWLEEEFGDTDEGIWLRDNSHRFGFILRYPKGKEYITDYGYEPWHFRYVGVDHAQIIYNGDLTLEEYLLGGLL